MAAPALNPQQLAKLPPSVAALLASQSQGDQALPQQTDDTAATTSALQGALARRFGTGQEFDQQYNADVTGLLGQVPGIQSNYDTQRNQLGEDFTKTADQLDKANTRNREMHLNAMADRGLGYSGANLLGQERIGEQFQQGVQGANTALARNLSGLSADEANALRAIQARQATAEGAAAERARVRDETAAWQRQQEQLAQQQLAQQQQAADQANQQAAAQQAAYQQQLAELERQALASSQPMPTATGTYAPPATGGAAPARNTDSNVSFNTQEYNLRDPNEVKQLQYDLGLRPDGIMGPQTWGALDAQNAVYFNDRPIDPTSRLRITKGSLYSFPGSPRDMSAPASPSGGYPLGAIPLGGYQPY